MTVRGPYNVAGTVNRHPMVVEFKITCAISALLYHH